LDWKIKLSAPPAPPMNNSGWKKSENNKILKKPEFDFWDFTVPVKSNESISKVEKKEIIENDLEKTEDIFEENVLDNKISLSASETTEEDSSIDPRTPRWEVTAFVKNVDISALVDQFFNDAVASRTSDIHIEPFENFLWIRFRIDWEFYEYRNFATEYWKLLLTRIQILAWLKIDQLRAPQDWKISAWIIAGKRIDMRVSTLPTIYWNKVVIRILEKENKIKTLPDLGYDHDSIKIIKRNLNRTYWMILMSWPTWSWKSTTLFWMLSKYDPFKYNISTLEDPVEYFIDWANQSQINPEVGFDFSDWLRSLVRQDPDIIMLWEIRDNTTTKLAVQAAITGHLVFSTVHANTASTTVQRLMNMWADPFLVASALNLVISQRLVRRNCKYCVQPYNPPKKQLESIKNITNRLDKNSHTNFHKWVWCDQCHWSWYLGRIAIYEILEITPWIEKVISETWWIWQKIEEVAVKEWMITIKENWVIEAMKWNTTLEEILIAVDDQWINNDIEND